MSAPKPTRLKNFFGGQHHEPQNQRYLPCYNPATGELIAEVPDSGRPDLESAVAAAKHAFPAWQRLSSEERSGHLRKLGHLIRDHLDELARLETEDTGKPLKTAREVDLPRSVRNFEFFADATTQFASEAYSTPVALHYSVYEPLGIVGCISPWNLPLYLFTWKIAPALASGNCVVAKPSEVTPLTAHRLSELIAASDFPSGVLNILHGTGSGIGGPLVEHADVRAISFTGSTATGAQIARATAGIFKKLSLEMGGKNPFLVFADADLDLAAAEAVRAGFSNQGQICLCGSRILVEESIAAEFVQKVVTRVKNLRVGDPLDDATDQGALVSQEHLQKVEMAVQTALREGGKILTGGHPVKLNGRCSKGNFYAPTVLEGLGPQTQTNQQEIFGPVVSIATFKNEKEALDLANGTSYGLAASIWTQNLSRAMRVSQEVKSGVVWVNTWMLRDLRTPFGGMKTSGYGREGGFAAMRFFSEAKSITIGGFSS